MLFLKTVTKKTYFKLQKGNLNFIFKITFLYIVKNKK